MLPLCGHQEYLTTKLNILYLTLHMFICSVYRVVHFSLLNLDDGVTYSCNNLGLSDLFLFVFSLSSFHYHYLPCIHSVIFLYSCSLVSSLCLCWSEPEHSQSLRLHYSVISRILISSLNYLHFSFSVISRCCLNLHSHYLSLAMYSGSNNYLIACWFCRFAHLQRMELCIILIIGTF